MAEGPTPLSTTAQRLHALADAGHEMAAELRAAADKVQNSFDTWLHAAEHAATHATEEAKAATKEAWNAWSKVRDEAKALIAKAAAPIKA